MANSTTTKIACPQFGCTYSSQLMLPGSHTAGCCDSVRSPLHDSLASHSLCPCQLDRVLQHRVSTMPVNLLPRPPFNEAGFTIGATDLSAFYSPLARPCDIKEWRDSWYLQAASAARHPLDVHGFDPHSHTACPRLGERFSPIDLAAAGARRKNATRETTSTLKAWLYEHRKNPYPTKGEKIMLAIITKMTLTQVSTWFANARRRLKKENKMTWSPRNRCGEKKNGLDDDDLASDSECEEQSCEDDKMCDSKGEKLNSIKESEERKENIQSNTDTQEHTKNSLNLNSVESLSTKPTNPVIRFQALRAVHCVTSAEPNVEDSPVKSLRKWVDGCFHNTPANLMNIGPVPCETPPSTPPQRSSTEASVIISVRNPTPSLVKTEKNESETSPQKSPPTPIEDVNKEKPKLEEETATVYNPITTSRSVETTNYREIDAALALTTLSSR